MGENDPLGVGQRVRQYRTVKGITQRCLARQLGVAQATLSRVEAGGDLPLSLFVRLCKALDTTPDRLLFWDSIGRK